MNTRNLFQGIDTIIVRVGEIKSAKDWYTQKLGLLPVWDDEQMRLVVMDTGGPTSLTLWQTDRRVAADPSTAAYPIFSTADALATRQELIARGVDAGEVIEDEAINYFRFFDPDGNMLEACQVISEP